MTAATPRAAASRAHVLLLLVEAGFAPVAAPASLLRDVDVCGLPRVCSPDASGRDDRGGRAVSCGCAASVGRDVSALVWWVRCRSVTDNAFASARKGVG
jgi:hypothetical protein